MKRRDFLKGAGGLVAACSLGFYLHKLARILAPGAADPVGPMLADGLRIETVSHGANVYARGLLAFQVNSTGARLLRYADGTKKLEQIIALAGCQSQAGRTAGGTAYGPAAGGVLPANAAPHPRVARRGAGGTVLARAAPHAHRALAYARGVHQDRSPAGDGCKAGGTVCTAAALAGTGAWASGQHLSGCAARLFPLPAPPPNWASGAAGRSTASTIWFGARRKTRRPSGPTAWCSGKHGKPGHLLPFRNEKRPREGVYAVFSRGLSHISILRLLPAAPRQATAGRGAAG